MVLAPNYVNPAMGDADLAGFLAAQGLTYYRLADGRITLDDPFTRPDLAQLLGLAPPAA